jgi:heptosyltransferase-3
VEGCRGLLFAGSGKQERVDLLDQVIAALVKAIDLMLGMGYGRVRSIRAARLILLVPKIKVGAVVAGGEGQQEVFRGIIAGCGGSEVPEPGEVVLECGEAWSLEHEVSFWDELGCGGGNRWARRELIVATRCHPTQNTTMPRKPERVLIYRLGSLGDMVVALPALHLVARSFTAAERRMLTNFPVHAKAPAAAAVLPESLVQGYFRYVAGVRSPLELVRLWWSLVRWRPQVLVYLGAPRGVRSARRDAWFFRCCGIWRQIGVPLREETQANLPQEAGLEPECERLVRNLAVLGDAGVGDRASWCLSLTSSERARAREVLAEAEGRAVLAVSVGTKVQSKDWGRERWRALLHAVGEAHPDYALALLGVREEAEVSEYAAAGWRAGAGGGAVVLNLCGTLTPRESAACLARSKLFLGHDSGPMHLAAAVGTPCVAIFAARNLPRVWFPYGPGHRVVYHAVECAGCGLETCVVERKRCLKAIAPAEVLRAVEGALGYTSRENVALVSSKH